jgi:hypothetical protein
MTDDIVEWLSDTEKWLSHVGSGAHGVDRLDRGRVNSVNAHEGIQLAQRRSARGGAHGLRPAWAGVGFGRAHVPLLGRLAGWLF